MSERSKPTDGLKRPCLNSRRWNGRHDWSTSYRNRQGEIEEECYLCGLKRTGSEIPKRYRDRLTQMEERRRT